MARERLERLDTLLVKRGLAPSRARARELIEAGRVLIDGIPATKAATRVQVSRPVRLKSTEREWVGRGARKLLGALASFELDPAGAVCADLGASTGGFTEVLLEHGAQRVYAIDVGRGQLHRRLETDDRVIVMDGVNARHLDALPEPIDLIVGDLSFISLALILPTVRRLLRSSGEAVVLVKPQFEAGRSGVGSGGVVRDANVREQAIRDVQNAARDLGFEVLGSADSVLPGARAGNVEHFLHLRLLKDQA